MNTPLEKARRSCWSFRPSLLRVLGLRLIDGLALSARAGSALKAAISSTHRRPATLPELGGFRTDRGVASEEVTVDEPTSALPAAADACCDATVDGKGKSVAV